MKRIALAFIAAAGLAVTAARADHVDVRASINLGRPAYVTPVQMPIYGPVYDGRGYWQDVSTRVWVPPHWEVTYDYYGRRFNQWQPGHYEMRNNRVWVRGWASRFEHERWEHNRMERERWEHARRDDHRNWDGRRNGDHRR
jgi:hypothetical protein